MLNLYCLVYGLLQIFAETETTEVVISFYALIFQGGENGDALICPLNAELWRMACPLWLKTLSTELRNTPIYKKICVRFKFRIAKTEKENDLD